MPRYLDEQPVTFEFEHSYARKRHAPLCGPLGRVVGVFTMVCAVWGVLSRTSLAASSLLVAQTALPGTSQELLTCLSNKCNSTLTAVGRNWNDPLNARLLKCLTHSPEGTSAAACWSPDTTEEGRAVQTCAVCNFCAAGEARCGTRTSRTALPPSQPPVGGTGGFDWSQYAGDGWKKFVAGPAAQQSSKLLSGTQASVLPQPVVASLDNQELLACLKSNCPKESDKVGCSWSNPVNTALTACLADSQSGLVAAVTCFPPVDPSHETYFRDSTALRFCALCSSCIAGDRGSQACSKAGFKGEHSLNKLGLTEAVSLNSEARGPAA